MSIPQEERRQIRARGVTNRETRFLAALEQAEAERDEAWQAAKWSGELVEQAEAREAVLREALEELGYHVGNCGPCRGDKIVGSPTVHLRWVGQFVARTTHAALSPTQGADP